MLTRRGRFATEGPDSGRRRASGVVVAVLAAVVLATFAASASASAGAHQIVPRMLFNHRLSVATVCFAVTNPAGGQSMLYGLRYIENRGRADPSTPAIVLVHGIASSTENWDFSPTWSVARALAAAGYVVYSYDRLGYAKSSYFITARRRLHADDGSAPGRAAPDRRRGQERRLHDHPRQRLFGAAAPEHGRQPQGRDHRPQRRRLDRRRLSRRVSRYRGDDPGRHRRLRRTAAARHPATDSLHWRGLHAGPEPSRLLRVLPDPPELRGLQHLSAGRGGIRRPDRVHAPVSGFAVRRDHRLRQRCSRRTMPRSA